MDHALYPFRTFAEGPRIEWPAGARTALTVTVMLDHWEWSPPQDASPDPRIVSPLGKFFPDWLTWSQREYGNRVGIFRILDVLDRYGVAPSVALGAEAARRYPELVDECAQRGACFMAHGTFATRRITQRMSEAEERAHIAESRAAVQAATGAPPPGWCGQDFNESTRTPALLAESGFAYTTDWSNDDRPYVLSPGVIALPSHSDWNDLEAMWLRRVQPPAWSDLIAEGFNVLHAEGGMVVNLTLHPWIAGQASRIRYVADALSRVLGQGGVWRTTCDAAAEVVGKQIDRESGST